MISSRRKRASTLCVHQGRLLLVRLKDPVSGEVVQAPPGGGIEEGEDPLKAALRETLEETGYEMNVDPDSLSVVDYTFFWAGKDRDCTTYFYKAKLADADKPPKEVRDDPWNIGIHWVPLAKAKAAMSHCSQARDAILEILG